MEPPIKGRIFVPCTDILEVKNVLKIEKSPFSLNGVSSVIYFTTSLYYAIGTLISCAVPDDCVEEGSTVTVTCTRSIDLSEQSRIRVNTEDGSATG